MKKIIIMFFMVFSFGFACGDKTLHDSAESLIKQEIFVSRKGKIITLNAKNLALMISNTGKTGDNAIELSQQILIGMQIYALNHGYKLEVSE